MRRPRHTAWLFVGVCSLLGCSADPAWTLADVPSEPPDHQYQVGGGYVEYVYVWECVEARRVVVHQGCADMTGCDVAVVERVACGDTSALERGLAGRPREDIVPSRRWPGS